MSAAVHPQETQNLETAATGVSIGGPVVASNPRGIPRAPFVDQVEKYVKKPDQAEVEAVLAKFNETLWMYKRMEMNVLGRKKNLLAKMPELKKALQTVKFLLEQQQPLEKPLKVQFELCDTMYATGEIPDASRVCLWLGANVMLEYSTKEANDLLSKKVDQAERSLVIVEEDIDFLREQITTMEVNIARVYNWDVKRRKAAASRA